MKTEEALDILKGKQFIKKFQFEILQVAARLCRADPEAQVAKELILRALENIDHFSRTKSILNSLVREIGLFPYLEQEDLSLDDAIAYEYHRAENLSEVIFHQEQLPIYQKILDGKNIVLSAPTSFGKSKIIDGVIAAKKFQNIVVVVPTLALIDETRKRLTKQFSTIYTIIGHPSQMPVEGGSNIFVFTPERYSAQ